MLHPQYFLQYFHKNHNKILYGKLFLVLIWTHPLPFFSFTFTWFQRLLNLSFSRSLRSFYSLFFSSIGFYFFPIGSSLFFFSSIGFYLFFFFFFPEAPHSFYFFHSFFLQLSFLLSTSIRGHIGFYFFPLFLISCCFWF